MQSTQKTKYARVDVIAGIPSQPKPDAEQGSYALEIPKQLTILLFFALFFSFALHAWRDSRFFASDELLMLLGVRTGAGLLFWWLEIDD